MAFMGILNKKIKAIMDENLLFSFRENIIVFPILLYIFLLYVYITFGNTALIMDFQNAGYVSFMSNVGYILGLIVIIFLSITSFDKDIKTKNIYIILQNVNKKEYFLGKLLSIFLISTLLNVIIMFIFNIGYLIEFKKVDFSLNYIFLFQELEFLIIAFISSLFSLAINKTMPRLLTIIVFVIVGHLVPNLKQLLDNDIIKFGDLGKSIVNTTYYIFPNLELTNVKDIILINSDLKLMFLKALFYTIFLIIILYHISMKVFNKKDF